jgi:hypothetical protein
MRGDSDNQVLDIARPKSSIRDMLKAPGPGGPLPEAGPEPADSGSESPVGEKLIPLPQPGDPYDAAYARPDNKPLPTLRFVMGDQIRGLPYANLDSIDWVPADQPGGSPAIVLRFTGLIAREARIRGRHLLLLFDLLSYHRIAWVRELPEGRDFKDTQKPVIRSITVEPIKEFPA